VKRDAAADIPSHLHFSTLNRDALDVAFQLQLFEGNPTTIPEIRLDDVRTQPRKVLDIGCGSGDWILAAARAWPETSFVGLDLVIGHQIPLHLLDSTYSPSHDHDSRPRQQRLQQQPQQQQQPQTVNIGLSSLDQPSTVSPPAPASQSRAAKFSVSTPVGSTLGSRIEWVQSNFLKSLPFLDEEFDYIHVSGIARGVPEDKVSRKPIAEYRKGKS
jgi:SAM-dependent methyltransferase